MNTVVQIKVLAAMIILVAYAGLSTVGILSMSPMSHSGHHEPTCPYMVGEQALCQMTIGEHVSAWQQFSRAVFPDVLLLAIALVALYGFSYRLYRSPPYTAHSRWRTIVEPLYQTLFSNGILHSKAF
jgi:hypothetical protein